MADKKKPKPEDHKPEDEPGRIFPKLTEQERKDMARKVREDLEEERKHNEKKKKGKQP